MAASRATSLAAVEPSEPAGFDLGAMLGAGMGDEGCSPVLPLAGLLETERRVLLATVVSASSHRIMPSASWGR